MCKPWPLHRALGIRCAPLMLALQIGSISSAQDTLRLDLGPDTVMCPGMYMSFHANPGFLLYTWDDGSNATYRTIRGPGTIHCEALELLKEEEVITNGDFSAGDTHFMTDLAEPSSGPHGSLSNPGSYGVGTAPNSFHSYFAGNGDHTSGHGNMLVVNGDTLVGDLWCGKGRVQPFTEYVFSFWHAAMDGSYPAEMSVTINGEDLGLQFKTTKEIGVWKLAHVFWTSTDVVDVMVCILNSTTTEPGNDFALDDMSLAPFRMHYDTVEVGLPEWCPDDGTACGCQVMIPSAFTPNGDDINDVLLPRHDCPIKTWYFRVIDHWGRTVFSTEDQLQGWDGLHTSDGSTTPAGLYTWTLETRSDAVEFPMPCFREGYVMLIR